MSSATWLRALVVDFVSRHSRKLNAARPGTVRERAWCAEALEPRVVLSASPFTPGDLVVYRLGDSSDFGGTSAATNVYLNEYTPSGTLVQSVEVTTANGTTFTDSGSSSSGGQMTLGPDGKNLGVFGYDATEGTAGVTGTATESIGIVGANGTVTLNTATADTTSNARSATYDSSSGKLYIAGGTNLSEASLSSATSAPGTFTSIVAHSVQSVEIFDGHLFYTRASSGVFDEGSEPTTSAAGTLLTGADTSSTAVNTSSSTTYTPGSAQTFFFADLTGSGNWNSTGFNTLYIIDTNSGSGALLKYSYSGTGTSGTWTSEGAIVGPDTTGDSGASGSASGAQLLGITGSVSNGTATLYLTEGNDGGSSSKDYVTSKLYSYTDSSATATLYSGATPGTLTPITLTGGGIGSTTTASSSVYENFRGLAFAPSPSTLAIGGLSSASVTSGSAAATNISGGSATFADTLTSSQLNTSTLTVAITANGDSAHDILGITSQGTGAGQIGVSGSNVTYAYPGGSATTIGTFTGGSSGNSLVVTLNSSATAVAVQALINQINFNTTTNSSATRTVQFTFTPSSGNGSAVSSSESVSVTVPTPSVNAGSPISLSANSGAYTTTVTGINDGESDSNANVTSVVATYTNGSLFSSVPAITNFSSANGTATLGFTPASGQTGTSTITVTVTNNLGATATATYNLTVNTATPTINAGGPITLPENQTVYTTTVTGINDGESDSNANVTSVVATYTSSNPSLFANGGAPAVTNYSSANGTATLGFTLAGTQTGTATITVTVTNSANNTATATYNLTVTAVTPTINAGSAITLGENYGAFTTTLTGINDGESDGNTNVTSVAASVTGGSMALFASGPTVTNYSSASGTATLGFTLATNQTGSATITVTVTNAATNTATATYSLTVNPITVTTSAPTVVFGQPVTIASTNLTATESGVTAANIQFTLTGNPPAADGTIDKSGVALSQNSTFTQADINNGLITYVSTGSASATDSIAFNISDLTLGGSLSGQSLNVSIIPPFTPGNIAVLDLAAASSNTTGSVLEVSPSTGSLVSTTAIASTGTNAIRFSDAGTSSFLSDTNDGSLLAFSAYNTTTSAGNLDGVNPRAVGTLNSNKSFNLATSYNVSSTDLSAGNKARSATSLNDSTWFITDQGGLYTNGSGGTETASLSTNILNTRAFGGTVYISSTTASAAVSTVTSPTASSLTGLPGIAADSKIQDFYLIQSGSNGSTYDILYTLDQGTSSGTINKFSLVGGTWVSNGSVTFAANGESMIAENDGAGGAYLYVTTSSGTANNSLVRLTDSVGWVNNSSPTSGFALTNSTTLYTDTNSDFLKGLAFVPASAAAPIVASPTSANVGISTATLGGTVTSTGSTVGSTGSQIVSGYGIVYALTSANATPTIGGTGVTQIAGSGSPVFAPFTVSATSLAATSQYSYAAYVTNSTGTTYSSVGTFTTVTAPTINAGSPVTLPENSGAYTTGLTGINDGESDGNINVTSVAAAVTSGNSALFSAGPTVSGYTSPGSTATLGFTLAANQSGTATITVTVTNKLGYTGTATYVVTVNPITITSTTAAVAAGNSVSITSANLTAAESGVTAANLVFTLTGNPPAADGTLEKNGVPLAQNSTFTQADINNGLITYVSTGSGTATDSIAFTVSDSAGGSLINQSFSVSVIEPQALIPGDLAVLQLAAKSDNTTGSILELNSSTANQSSPVESIPLTEMGFSDSGTSSFLSDTNDGTLLSFAAYNANSTTSVSEAISGASWSSGTVTIDAANSFAAGNSVTITGIAPSAYDGTFTISAIGSGANANATFSYALGSNPGTATQFASASATSLTTDLAYDVATNARGVGTLNAAGTFNMPTTYTEIAAGDQARSATSLDDSNWLITDKQGTYTNGDSGNWIDFNTLNARSFGGVIYISSTAPKTPAQTGPEGDTSGAVPPAAVLTLASPTSIIATGLPGLPTDANIQDFYLIQSGVNGNTYDILYTLDATGVINKFSLTNPGQSDATWVSGGSYTMTGAAGLSLIAQNNGTGGATLYVTTSTKLEELTDTAGYDANIDITSSPVTLYTATGSNVLKGLAFTPSDLPNFSISAAASSGAAAGGDFNDTLTATNSGPAGATGVSVKFTLPAGETFVSASGNDGFTGADSNGVVTFTGGTLSSGASATLTITVSASTAGTYTIPVGAAVIDPGNAITQGMEYFDNFNTSAVTTAVTNAPDLAVNVSAPATAYTNQPFNYSLSAANNGNTAATWTSNQVAIQFALPSSNLVVTATSASSFGFTESQSGSTVYFSGGTLAALTTDLLTVTVTDPDVETATVAAGAAQVDPNNDITKSPLDTSTSSTSTPATVITAALTISDIPIAPVVNTSFTGAVASFSDARTPGTISATIYWGDGSNSPGTISSMQEDGPANPTDVEPTQAYTLYVVTGTHTYDSTGTEAVAVDINDGGGDSGTVSESASVGEPPLQITPTPFNAAEQTAFTNQTVATFTDPGIAGAGASGPASQYTSQFTASVNWGDNTAATTGTITFNSTTGVFSVQGSHTYASLGTYPVTTTVTPQTISVTLLDSSDPTALTKDPSAEFIQQLSPSTADQTAPINTVALPTVGTTSGNFALTASGASPSESRLHLSVNGEYLVLGGYDATAAMTSDQSYLDSPSTVYRVIGTVDGQGDVNTTTALTDADYLDNFRGAVTVNGTSFYTYGSSDNLYGTDEDSTGFVHYVASGDVGSANTSTEITNVDNDNNGVEIFNSTLYDAIRSPKTGNDVSGIYVVGTPGTLPTTANQTSTLFIEVPQTNPFTVDDSNKTTSPYDFFMADLPGNTYSINGVNVAYIADGSTGIARYDYDQTGSETMPQWNFSYYISSTGTFSPSLYTVDNGGENDGQLYTTGDYSATSPPPVDPSLAGGVTGLTGEVLPNGQVELFGVTAGVGYGSIKNGVPANSVIEVTDTGTNANYTVLATAGSDAEYRGVALSPSAVVMANASVAYPTSLAAAAATGTYGGTTTLSATLTNTALSAGVGSETISFSLNGTPVGTAMTNSGGVATLPGVSLTGFAAGSVSITASFAGDANNAASSGSNTLSISRASPIITWANPANIVYGTALGATQLDASANVGGTFTYSPVAGTVLHAGTSQTLSVTFTPGNTSDYTGATATAMITVTQATPVITWPTPANIQYGTPLSGVQLDATSGAVAGSFVYTPGSGTTPSLGTQTLQTVFTPTDTQDYKSVTATTSITVVAPPNGISTTGATRAGKSGTLYNQQANFTGVAGTYTFTLSNLPAGVTLSAATLVSGSGSVTPVTAGSNVITFTVNPPPLPASPGSVVSFTFQISLNDPSGVAIGYQGNLAVSSNQITSSPILSGAQTVVINATAGQHTYTLSSLPTGVTLASVIGSGVTMAAGPNGTWVISFDSTGSISFVLNFSDPSNALINYIGVLQ